MVVTYRDNLRTFTFVTFPQCNLQYYINPTQMDTPSSSSPLCATITKVYDGCGGGTAGLLVVHHIDTADRSIVSEDRPNMECNQVFGTFIVNGRDD